MNERERNGIGLTSLRSRDRLVADLAASGITSRAVLDRMRDVPRHLFIEEALRTHAYEDTALPIGHGQTISQPYIVALMTQALIGNLPAGQTLTKVLEIGSGCGYQTAVLAPFARHVYSVERIGPLVKRSRHLLRDLGIHNVSLRHSDGLHGWRSQAPYQGILVAAAPEDVPDELLEQLDDGGRLLIPVGRRGRQTLVSFMRRGRRYEQTEVAPVSFVPLVEGTES